MSLETASTFRYSLRRNDGVDQSLHIRLGFLWRLLSRSPSSGLPYEILYEIPSSSPRETTFPLSLRDLEDPLFCEAYIAQLLHSLDLGAVTCDIVARKITSVVVEVLESGNYDVKFQIAAEIDHVQMFWAEEERSSVPVENGERRGIVVEERAVLEEAPARRRAAERESKRLKMEKFDELKRAEMGDCCVCYEELNDVRKEVSRIRCGHIYHKSCILTWLQSRNSCPLCRREIEFEI
ncbi:putative RING-H2 finger protein ATL53 [Benincasa hispida]|uniref:putative RING-H2 finger protein ATL53 n=1 Tax=Benincasa hispida TaxID=102211 RepID=UPI0019026385|nr:putative RING-H2 finger protein ATL53 [Benincasa hispida]